MKKFLAAVLCLIMLCACAAVAEETPKEHLGELNVNGAFTLQCRLAEGYTMTAANWLSNEIIASITSEDPEKPILFLSIAFDEMYAGVDRMNDLPEEELARIEKTFTDVNEVEISYTETAYGTKLMLVRETGNDTDYADFFTIYKGYAVEFLMTPNPDAVSRQLTDEQVQMCIDFLSDLDFIPA